MQKVKEEILKIKQAFDMGSIDASQMHRSINNCLIDNKIKVPDGESVRTIDVNSNGELVVYYILEDE